MSDSDKTIVPETKQNGSSNIDLSQVPEETREWLKSKLGEDTSLTQENFLKMATSYQNVEKKIGQKEEEIVKSLFEDPDSAIMKALKKEKSEEEPAKTAEPKATPKEEITPEQAKILYNELRDEKDKEREARQDALDAKISESEKRMEQEENERNILRLDTGYRELISEISEEEVGPYVNAVIEILWDKNTGKPRTDAGLFLQSRNPVRTALKFYLSETGSNPDLLFKLSKPVYTEGSGGNIPAGKASTQLSKSDKSVIAAAELDKELREVGKVT